MKARVRNTRHPAMTSQGALKWLVAGGALGVAALFADLPRPGRAQAEPPSAVRSLPSPPAQALPRDPAEPAVPAPGASGAETPLTLTYWNVEWFPGRKPVANEEAKAAHVAAVVPVVERLDPDVLGLEEVADEAAARLLTEHLKGFRVDACTQFVRDGGEPTRQQTVLCSRLPLLQAWCEPWKPGASGLQPRRGFAFGAYQPAPGKVLLVYVTHLKSNREDEAGGADTNIAMREEAARQLLVHEAAMMKAYAGLGRVELAVVGGDLNTSLDDPRFEKEATLRSWVSAGFRWVWEGVPLGDRLTLPSEGRYPSTCFDHVFLHGSEVKVRGVSIEPTGKDASDHRPVTVRLTM